MKKYFLILIVIFPLLCSSQDMRVSTKNNGKEVFTQKEVSKVTFSDFKCIPNGIKDNIVIKTFKEMKNYPNPFNDVTNIEFNLNKTAKVVINIYNSQGVLTRTLFSSTLNSGNHRISWDGKNDRGNNVMTGMYFYQVKIDNEIFSNKMFVIK